VVPEMFLNYSLAYLHANQSIAFRLFAQKMFQKLKNKSADP
jgi:hypothetical protein